MWEICGEIPVAHIQKADFQPLRKGGNFSRKEIFNEKKRNFKRKMS